MLFFFCLDWSNSSGSDTTTILYCMVSDLRCLWRPAHHLQKDWRMDKQKHLITSGKFFDWGHNSVNVCTIPACSFGYMRLCGPTRDTPQIKSVRIIHPVPEDLFRIHHLQTKGRHKPRTTVLDETYWLRTNFALPKMKFCTLLKKRQALLREIS